MDLHLSISKGFVSSKIYDKHDVFDFDIVNFLFLFFFFFFFLDDNVPCSTSYGFTFLNIFDLLDCLVM